LEKAYAKVYSGYKYIEAGLTSESLRNLTGAPAKDTKNDDVEKTWEFILEGITKDFILTSGSKADDKGNFQVYPYLKFYHKIYKF